jgi:hypothetical protein
LKSVSSIALTSNIWSGSAKEDYLNVVAYYVNVNLYPLLLLLVIFGLAMLRKFILVWLLTM